MIPPSLRILVCEQPVDMRRSFDGLAYAASLAIGGELAPGVLVCFLNKRKSHIKAIWRDPTGVCRLYKRAHQAIFSLPAGGDGGVIQINGAQLAQRIAGVAKNRTK
ncbi:MAG: IS66 family insertion sequence element accessory protein TnpB [Myxococcales bacterium]|nr:IS66 family insertion sequence element accessory protein TnpB [Myxococcales bacterium]